MNGYFNVNKPFDMSSAKAVWHIKKKLNIQDKIGHMGTLDPFATGVLVVGVGRANRLFDVMLDKRKTYIATFEFGYQTATLDMESEEIVARSDIIPTKEGIENTILTMVGKQEQVAPQYSAKCIQGTRAYVLARNGQVADIKAHKIEIYSFKMLEQKSETVYSFEIECSGGTYIRSICRDLAKKLNTVATMTALQRTKCGDFDIKDSKNIEDFEEKDLISVEKVLKHLPVLDINSEQIQKIKNGLPVILNQKSGLYRVYDEGKLISIAQIDDEGATKMKSWLI